MLVYLFERQLASQLFAQHHHPGNPEEDEVAASLQDGVGVEALEVSRLWREQVLLENNKALRLIICHCVQ